MMFATPASWKFDQEHARYALQALNRRVAGIYRQEYVPDVRVEFVDLIEEHVVKDWASGENKVIRRTVGHCIQSQKLIRIVLRRGWEYTAIHEFVHFYNAGHSEQWVKKATQDVARLLKQGGLWTEPVGP